MSDQLWVVSHWHHRIHHRSDPKVAFDTEEEAKEYAEKCQESTRITQIQYE